jgi:hypothetical protein
MLGEPEPDVHQQVRRQPPVAPRRRDEVGVGQPRDDLRQPRDLRRGDIPDIRWQRPAHGTAV